MEKPALAHRANADTAHRASFYESTAAARRASRKVAVSFLTVWLGRSAVDASGSFVVGDVREPVAYHS